MVPPAELIRVFAQITRVSHPLILMARQLNSLKSLTHFLSGNLSV